MHKKFFKTLLGHHKQCPSLSLHTSWSFYVFIPSPYICLSAALFPLFLLSIPVHACQLVRSQSEQALL